MNNRELVDMANEIMTSSDISFEHHKRFFNNKGQFRDIYYADNTLEATVPDVGDVIRLVGEIQNSYNGSTRAGIRFYFQRLACLNGMTSNVFGFGHMFKHSLGNIDWQEQILKATNLLRTQSEYKLQQFSEACGKLQKPIDFQELKVISENNDYLGKLPTQQYGQIVKNMVVSEHYPQTGNEFTAWDLLNSGTETLWHQKKITQGAIKNNALVVDGLLRYGKDTWDEPFLDPNQMSLDVN